MLDFSTNDAAALPGKICLCGVGAAGAKVMEEALALAPRDASVCVMNLDARVLNASSVPCKIHLGARLTKGLGSGGDASLGAQAARESEASILRALEGSALTVIAAGLGGGTGSGVAPEVARLAKEQGSYVVSVVIRPFRFEGERRSHAADEALARLALYSDMVLRFDNDAMEALIDSDKGVLEAFSVVNALIARAVLIVPSLLDSEGSLLRVGLDDLSHVAGTGRGICSFGVGEARGDDLVAPLLEQVKKSPLFLGDGLRGVDDVLVLVRGGHALTLQRLEALVSGVAGLLGSRATLHIGASVEETLADRVRLTVLGVVPAAEPAVQPTAEPIVSPAAERMTPPEPIVMPEPVPAPPLVEPAAAEVVAPVPVHMPVSGPAPEKPAPVPVVKKNEHELDEELISHRVVTSAPPPSRPAPAPVKEAAAEPVEKTDPGTPATEPELPPALKNLEEGRPPAEDEEGRADLGMFARVRPLFLGGEDLDLPPALRKKKPDSN